MAEMNFHELSDDELRGLLEVHTAALQRLLDTEVVGDRVSLP